jgi:hypothetical protein
MSQRQARVKAALSDDAAVRDKLLAAPGFPRVEIALMLQVAV